MRKVLVIGAALLLVLVVAAVGAAWYFSGLIIDGARIKGETGGFTTEVSAISATTISYTVAEDVEDPATDLDTTSRTGMAFSDGSYLQLEQGASVDGRTVTRPYATLSGSAPQVGAQGRLDWPSWPDAEAMGLTSHDVTYAAPLGPTPAMVVDPIGTPNGTWVVVVHGRNGSVREGLRAAPEYAERGITAMLINYRDDKLEPDVPYEDGIGNFGTTEWPDLEAAVGYAVDHGAERVILAGWSMGGAIVASYLEHGSNTDVVMATQLDSPAVSFSETVRFGAEQMGLPTTALAPVIWLAERATHIRANLDFSATEYRDNAETWPVPALVTAGTRDDLVPPESIEEFADAVPDGQFELFDGAAHTGEWNFDYGRYEDVLGSWLDQVVRATQ